MSPLDALMVASSRTGISIIGKIPSWIFLFYLFTFPLIFHFISPYVVSFQHPELAILNAHSKVVACTDAPEHLLLPADTPLPLCTDPIESQAISCAYTGSRTYRAPEVSTPAQDTLCPKLVSSVATGSTTPLKDSPIYPFNEMAFRIVASIWMTTGLLAAWIVFGHIRNKILLAR